MEMKRRSSIGFENNYNYGRVAESYIARWMMRKGYSVLPVYEKLHDGKGGPRIFSLKRNYIAPDMMVIKKKSIFWIEAKHKNAFSWYRKKQIWTTGIDRNHFKSYLDIASDFSYPVWILFLHRDGIAKDTPKGMQGPTGLFGGEIFYLGRSYDHTSVRHGRNGMIYWNHDVLKKLACLDEVLSDGSDIDYPDSFEDLGIFRGVL